MFHCWKDQHEHATEVHGFGSQEQVDTLEPGGTCIFERGHDGDHDFVPDDEIGIQFVEG